MMMAPSGASGGPETSVNQEPQRNEADAGPSQAKPAGSYGWETYFPPVPADLSPLPSAPSVPSLPSNLENSISGGEQEVEQPAPGGVPKIAPQSSGEVERGAQQGPVADPAPLVGGEEAPVPLSPNHEQKEQELQKLIELLPKKELNEIIGESSISRPIEEYSAEYRASLREQAMQHYVIKNEIIQEMASLYPEKGWELSKLIREKFFLSRGNRELDLISLNTRLEKLKTEKKRCGWARELNYRLEYWDWK